MSEQNKALVRRLLEEDISQGLPIADEIIHPNFYDHTNPPGMERGIEGHTAVVALFRSVFPDREWRIDDLIAEGDKVVARTTLRGTHLGPFMGIPPTGRRVEQAQIHILRFVDGKAVEHRAVRDDLGMLQQIGVVPEVWGVQARERVEI